MSLTKQSGGVKMSAKQQRHIIKEHYVNQGAKLIHFCALSDNVLIEDKSGARRTVKIPDYLLPKYNRQIK